ncbi:hypothetical protein QQF64_029615, partial [Cirrhinus molitorella]
VRSAFRWESELSLWQRRLCRFRCDSISKGAHYNIDLSHWSRLPCAIPGLCHSLRIMAVGCLHFHSGVEEGAVAQHSSEPQPLAIEFDSCEAPVPLMIAPCDKQHREELNHKSHSCLWLGQVLNHHLLPPKPAKPRPNSPSLFPTGFAIGTSGCGSAESRLENTWAQQAPLSLSFPPPTLSLPHLCRKSAGVVRVVPANFLTSRQETLKRAGPSKTWRAGGGSGSAGSGTLAATEGARPGPALT